MDDLHFNPMDPAFVADPYPTYRRLRAEDPVHQSPLGFWVLTRYEDVVAALRDPRLAKEAIPAFVAARFGLPVRGPGPVDARSRSARPHAPARPRQQGLHPARGGGPAPPHPADRRRPARPGREPGRRWTSSRTSPTPCPSPSSARCSACRSRTASGSRSWGLDIARGLDAIWLPPDSDVAKRSLAARHELADYFRDLIARRRAQPRADMLSGPHRRRGSGRQAERGGTARHVHPPPRRRSRDHGEPDRQRHARAPPASRPAPPAAGGSRADRRPRWRSCCASTGPCSARRASRART